MLAKSLKGKRKSLGEQKRNRSTCRGLEQWRCCLVCGKGMTGSTCAAPREEVYVKGVDLKQECDLAR